MKHINLLGFLIISAALSACAPINTEFSCGRTAEDRCLSIEEVNAMTESKDFPRNMQKTKPVKRANRYASNKEQVIWFAPWTDENGIAHGDEIMLASKSNNKEHDHVG